MADRGRDLKISILSDVDRFDAEKPAQELEKLGKEALDAKRDLDKLWDEANASKLDKLGDEAKSTAAKVDSAFEKIAASSKSNLRKVDDDVDHARRGMDDMKGEAGQSGREAAASFSGGFDSVTDFMQETAANALAGFGAVGGALGIAAAAGLGFLANKAAEAAENIKAARDSLRELYSNQDTTGIDKAKDFFEFLGDVGADLPGLNRVLGEAGISMEDFVRAGAEGGPVFEEVKRKLSDLGGSGLGLAGILGDDMASGAQGAYDALTQYREGAKGATEDNKIMGSVLDDTRLKQEAYNAELQKLADAKHAETFGAIEQGIREVGGASGEVAEAVAEDGQVTIAALTEALQEATEAAKDHAVNVQTALKEGGSEFAAWVAEQGAEVSQAYANGSAKERAALRAAFQENVGSAMGGGIAAGLQRTKGAVQDAAGNVYTAVENTMTGETILIPTKVGQPNNTGTVLRDVQNNMQPVVIPVMLQNVPRSVMSRYIP